MNNKWCEGKHSPTVNNVTLKKNKKQKTKTKPLRIAEFGSVFKIYVA